MLKVFVAILACLILGIDAKVEELDVDALLIADAPIKPNRTRPRGSCGQATIRQLVDLSLPDHRIIGGFESRPGSIPFIISLRRRGQHSCGGTLIRSSDNKEESDIVVTAAHCVRGGRADFDVVAGAHYRTKKVTGEQSVPAAKVVIHPSYQSNAHDIAIVRLSRPIKFCQTIQPICLPSGANDGPDDGEDGIVAGWGRTKTGGSLPDVLMQVTVPVVSSRVCKRAYGSILDPPSMLCAGYSEGGKDSCQGDSGGPYFMQGSRGYVLQGIVSFGNDCAKPNNPGVYTRVTNYVTWIQSTIKSLSRT